MTMTTDRLENIIKTRRGTTYLVNRLVDIEKISYAEATRIVKSFWRNDEGLSDLDIYNKLAERLAVDSVTISNDQFLNMIKNVIEHSDDFCMDPLMAVLVLCQNIERIGGLPALAKRMNRFADKL